MYLLDTNILSELRRVRPHAGVLKWIEGVANERLFLCAVTLGEIQAGIEMTRRQDPERAEEIEMWLDQISATHQVLAIDGPIFRRWARLMMGKSNSLIEDGLIAACAAVHGLVVVTRNTRDFDVFGVKTLNPFLRSHSGQPRQQ